MRWCAQLAPVLRVSIVIPVLNEAAVADQLIQSLPMDAEVIVVDGGSDDDTPRIMGAAGLRVIEAPRGRARQMNAGAAVATGDVLLFLHADTCLPACFATTMSQFSASGCVWGRFDIRLSGAQPLLRMVEFMMNWRSRLTGICTGDQAMFIRRDVFEACTGFADIALMEDIEISRRLRRISPPFRGRDRVVSSSRRWQRNGIVRTILQMWRLRLMYFFGASPASLARRYD